MQSYKVTERANGPGAHAVLKAPTPPKMTDFDLTTISIREIENACIVECQYEMKPAAVDKIKKETKRDYVDYDVKRTKEEHSFPTREESAAFISARVLGKDHAGSPTKAAPKDKVKVKVS